MGTFNKQKAFGQHFLEDPGVINGIVDATFEALSHYPAHSLLEIGPGKGAITRPILQRLASLGKIDTSFFVAERDRDLIEYWKPEARITQLLEGDFLKQTEESLKALGPFVVVSNLPYSAGTAIVVMLSELKAQIPEMILMFQAEVAKRLYSKPSTPDRGSLSLYIQNEWDVERLFVVKPGAFRPPPRVMSEVVRLRRRETPHIGVETEVLRKAWNDLLKTSFKQRRKMLKGNLNGTVWQQALETSGVPPTLRAESLDWDHWKALWKARWEG